ncbi:MAG: SUMF1/EgtB/PvdO family nonheme iron enzyme, partial [Vicinamibacterales bacterium]
MRSGGSAAVRLALWVLCTGSLAGQASIDLGWVRIDPGSLQMGCVPTDMVCRDDEQPRHEVTISTPFDVMATEVTVAQYAR